MTNKFSVRFIFYIDTVNLLNCITEKYVVKSCYIPGISFESCFAFRHTYYP